MHIYIDGPDKPCTVRTRVRVPLRLSTGLMVDSWVSTFHGLRDGAEHLAVELGPADTRTPLVRVHSECLTGDVFGSARCDCGPQLDEALVSLHAAGGVLVYLRQEGRGIGLYSKIDAYRLQDGGLDTYEANEALGLSDDLRDYTAAAQMLRALGRTAVDLLTNNPDKARQLAAHGITVHRTLPTGVHVNQHNRAYLTAKAEKTLHTIELHDLTEKEKIA
ncbi:MULTISPECIES: GTP cyclohydrolase II [Streptomyces]|uniref:GTP cyclohydrolase II n=1 Tax=Streptomyces TaxID=1883 RepID=UPI000CF28ADD|nr:MULTISPECIES: GTP cyclohydrolase II [Streptomyces]PPS69363.1 GTP cyclohydrolase [Streptomyces sp. 46]